MSNRVEHLCKHCGKAFSSYASVKRRYCSKACKDSAPSPARKHCESRSRLYAVWSNMKSRCNPNNKRRLEQTYYVSRGITVCDEWAASYETFRDWALANGYAVDLEIDRKDNGKGYSPDNCRWATRRQQMQNTRKRVDAETSKYRGVSKHSQNSRWIAQINRDGRPSYIGSFGTEEEAARAYDSEASKLFGEFASLNFKEDAKCCA